MGISREVTLLRWGKRPKWPIDVGALIRECAQTSLFFLAGNLNGV
jgi:hypothetical protein